jgi:hypothetical protein
MYTRSHASFRSDTFPYFQKMAPVDDELCQSGNWYVICCTQCSAQKLVNKSENVQVRGNLTLLSLKCLTDRRRGFIFYLNMMVSILLVVRRLSGNISECNLSNHKPHWSVSECSWIPPLLLFVYDVLYVTICQLFTTVSSSDFVQDTAQSATVLVGNHTTVVIASIHFKGVIVNMTLFSQ